MTTSKNNYPSCIDQFQVSHFRPVVMEIEIGGQSEKWLGGQESAAVDQDGVGSDASSHSFGLSLSLVGCLSLAGTGFLLGQRIARRNGKRSSTIELIFTKSISTYGHHFIRKFENATTHKLAHRKICLTPIVCKDMHFRFLFSLLFFIIQNTSSLIWWCSNTEPSKKKNIL